MTRTHRSMCSSLATSWYVKLWQGWKYLLIGTQVTQDQQYFQRVKWQYMILDEAQNIKNSSSARWKTLLGFQCRNRLLLTGTPIQNSMQGVYVCRRPHLSLT